MSQIADALKNAEAKKRAAEAGTTADGASGPTLAVSNSPETVAANKTVGETIKNEILKEAISDVTGSIKEADDLGFEDGYYGKERKIFASKPSLYVQSYGTGFHRGEQMKLAMQSQPGIRKPPERQPSGPKISLAPSAQPKKRAVKSKSTRKPRGVSRKPRAVQRNELQGEDIAVSILKVVLTVSAGIAVAVLGWQVGSYAGRRQALNYHSKLGQSSDD
jgi:hypothetical protein